jgi:hypothetical protein
MAVPWAVVAVAVAVSFADTSAATAVHWVGVVECWFGVAVAVGFADTSAATVAHWVGVAVRLAGTSAAPAMAGRTAAMEVASQH